MRWQTKKPEVKHGDERVRYLFAWRPVDVNGTTVWLERYGVVERYSRAYNAIYGFWLEERRFLPCFY